MSLKPTSFHVVERQFKENHIAWTYPTITDDLKTAIIQTCYSQGLEAFGLYYYKRLGNQFIYIKQFLIKNDKPTAVIVTSQYYQPDLYETICNCLASNYSREENVINLVDIYLNVYIKNVVCIETNKPGSYLNLADFPRKTDVKGTIKQLGIEIILVYNALLLKKQILVYHSNVEELQEALASLTRLVSFRKPEGILQPLLNTVNELKKNSTYYLIGTTNKSLLNHKNHCDVIIDLQSNVVEVSPKAKEDFVMSSLHKEVAHILIQTSESEEPEESAIKAISDKTSEIFQLLNKLKSEEGAIRIDDVENRKINKNLGRFLINLAKVENILVI